MDEKMEDKYEILYQWEQNLKDGYKMLKLKVAVITQEKYPEGIIDKY